VVRVIATSLTPLRLAAVYGPNRQEFLRPVEIALAAAVLIVPDAVCNRVPPSRSVLRHTRIRRLPLMARTYGFGLDALPPVSAARVGPHSVVRRRREGSSAIPQIGQVPGPLRTICGCMGQTYSTACVGVIGATGSIATTTGAKPRDLAAVLRSLPR
jgi:hypothetical protein